MRQVIIPVMQKRKQAQRGGFLAQVYPSGQWQAWPSGPLLPQDCFPSFHSLAGRVLTRRSRKEAGAEHRGLHGGYFLCLGHRGAKDSPGGRERRERGGPAWPRMPAWHALSGIRELGPSEENGVFSPMRGSVF